MIEVNACVVDSQDCYVVVNVFFEVIVEKKFLKSKIFGLSFHKQYKRRSLIQEIF